MDYKKLYEQSQEEISRLKANDEQSLQLTMQQNERFMDQLAQKDTLIDALKTRISEYKGCSLRDRDATPEDLRDYQQHLSDTIEETEDKYERKIQCSDIALDILRDENECNKKNLRKMMQENRELKDRIVGLNDKVESFCAYLTGDWKKYEVVEEIFRETYTEEFIQANKEALEQYGLFES